MSEIKSFTLDANIDGMEQMREFVLASDYDSRVHDLETMCDPAGLTAENALLRDQTRMLDAMIGRLKSELQAAAPTQGADARPVAMTNGSFHCPACGETMKGPLACGHCLWQKPEAVDAEIGADGIATGNAAPSDVQDSEHEGWLTINHDETTIWLTEAEARAEMTRGGRVVHLVEAASAPREGT